MPHSYRNYVHLEGIVKQDLTITPTSDGDLLAFPIAVQRKFHDVDGCQVFTTDLYNVELETAGARLAMNGAKTGSRVIIDGSLRAQPSSNGMVTVLAHRAVITHNSGTVKGLMTKNDPVGSPYRDVIFRVLNTAKAEEFEWKHGYGAIQQYRHIRTGGNIFIDAETRQFCSRKGKPMTQDAALDLAMAPAS